MRRTILKKRPKRLKLRNLKDAVVDHKHLELRLAILVIKRANNPILTKTVRRNDVVDQKERRRPVLLRTVHKKKKKRTATKSLLKKPQAQSNPRS